MQENRSQAQAQAEAQAQSCASFKTVARRRAPGPKKGSQAKRLKIGPGFLFSFFPGRAIEFFLSFFPEQAQSDNASLRFLPNIFPDMNIVGLF